MGFLRYAWLIPLVSGLVFLGGILALLLMSITEIHALYQPSGSSIVYLSDVVARKKVLWVSTSLVVTNF
jgi:hypothetical protein